MLLNYKISAVSDLAPLLGAMDQLWRNTISPVTEMKKIHLTFTEAFKDPKFHKLLEMVNAKISIRLLRSHSKWNPLIKLDQKTSILPIRVFLPKTERFEWGSREFGEYVYNVFEALGYYFESQKAQIELKHQNYYLLVNGENRNLSIATNFAINLSSHPYRHFDPHLEKLPNRNPHVFTLGFEFTLKQEK